MKIISRFMIIILLHIITFSIYDIHNNAFADIDQNSEHQNNLKFH
jgi:hypothetical protein